LFLWGLNLSIDFTGGSLLELSFSQTRPVVSEVSTIMTKDLGLKEAAIQGTGANRYIIRTSFLTEDEHQAALKIFRDKFQTKDNIVREESFETIGSSVSTQLRTRALWAIILVNLGIILYITYAFRKVSRPVASWKYGALAIVALIHDVLLVMGVAGIVLSLATRMPIAVERSAKTLSRSKTMLSMDMRPASILEKSRMSLMIPSRELAAPCTFSR